MDKLCKNCKYYKKPEGFYLKSDRGTCNNEKISEGFTDKDYPLNDKLEYADYEGYMAYLWVGQNFGCIHFIKLEKLNN